MPLAEVTVHQNMYGNDMTGWIRSICIM